MTTAEQLARARVAEAEALLVGLALPGTDAHTALLHLAATLSAGAAPSRSVLSTGLDALAGQAALSLRAGQHALAELRPVGELPHWTTGTAHEWQRYLRWLVATLDDLAHRGPTTAGWERASTVCAQAREVWGAVAGGAPSALPGRDDLDTEVVDGRVYVNVDELAGSLRRRAGAFADAARGAAVAGDQLGALVAEELASELGARADALDVAGIELVTGDEDPPAP